MNYLAVQASVPICFPNSNIITDIKNTKLKNDAVKAEWRQIYEYATNNGIEEPWVKAMSAIINKKFTIGGILPKKRTRRKIIKKLTRLLNWT
jgi:hypothetical protein